MTSPLFTIGFTKKSAEQFFELLQRAGVRRVVDIRENRSGQLAGFAKYPDIEFFLCRVQNIEYAHEPLLAPSPELRKTYRTTKDWGMYEREFFKLMRERKILETFTPDQFEGGVALLCSEAEPKKCHRRLVAEMFAKHWNGSGHRFKVRHLVLPKPAPRKPRRAKIPVS